MCRVCWRPSESAAQDTQRGAHFTNFLIALGCLRQKFLRASESFGGFHTCGFPRAAIAVMVELSCAISLPCCDVKFEFLVLMELVKERVLIYTSRL